MKTELDLAGGIATELYWDLPNNIKERIKRGDAESDKTIRKILEWMELGSITEDEDGNWRLFNL
ncbi:MAG: hypothetical protein WBC22_09095 [Sedimentisphaerales bacterium]